MGPLSITVGKLVQKIELIGKNRTQHTLTTGLVYLCRTIYDILLWLQALDVGGAMLAYTFLSLVRGECFSLFTLCIYLYLSGLWPIAMFCATRGMTHPLTSRNCEGNPQNSLTLLHFSPPHWHFQLREDSPFDNAESDSRSHSGRTR